LFSAFYFIIIIFGETPTNQKKNKDIVRAECNKIF